MSDATSPYLNRPRRAFADAVIDLAAARRARGLPAHPQRLASRPAAGFARPRSEPAEAPAPGKRIGCRVYIVAQGVFGTVISWKPGHSPAACMLAVRSGAIIYGVHENAVEPAPDAA